MGDPSTVSEHPVPPTEDVPSLALPNWFSEPAPVISELAREVAATFGPAILGMADLLPGGSPGGPANPPDWSKVSVQEWQQRAMAAAGIDPAKWDPSDGFDSNNENIQKVYALYAQWYLQHPELKWAGMAKLAGGTVYGGLLKLREERPGWSPRDVVTPILAYDKFKQHQMDKLERIFVGMQKNIFMDLAWQHQAYVQGGLPALKAAYDRGDMSTANYEAWVKIASGDENAR